MMTLDEITKKVLEQIDASGFKQSGAFNLRHNGIALCHGDSEHIKIKKKQDKPGIDIYIDGKTDGEEVHIPVVVDATGMTDVVYNDFYIEEGANVTIVAGCGIHNSGCNESRHDGIHTFHVEKNCNVRYVEKHYGEGEGTGTRVLNPVTEVYLGENSVFTLDTAQIKGVDSTVRENNVYLEANSKLYVIEKLMTHGNQEATSNMMVEMNGEGSSAQIVSRSVAKGSSRQIFHPRAVGKNLCHAHVQCDSIIMDHAEVSSIPEINAKHVDAAIIHEAAIGRINDEQLVKLRTLGMTEEEAEGVIIENFLNDIAGIKTTKTKSAALPDSERVELKKYLKIVCDGKSLTEDEAYKAMDIIMSDRASNAQIACLLTALRMKGETIDEITGFAKVMREKMSKVNVKGTLDIVGTGGDLSNSFNISTTSSFVIAAAGQKVAKHGNRSVSSKSGAADVLEALGVKIQSTHEQAEKSLDEIGLSFLFAQSYHSAMRFVGPTRAQIGVRTVFNILGPLANPAKADFMILGTYDPDLLEPMAKVLMNLGIKRAMLVYGNDRLDEVSISAPTTICEINGGKIIKYEIKPEDFGLKRGKLSDIVGEDGKGNAAITRGILEGTIKGAKRDIVLLNSGCALYICGKCDSIEEGVKTAAEMIDSGKALKKHEELVELTNRG